MESPKTQVANWLTGVLRSEEETHNRLPNRIFMSGATASLMGGVSHFASIPIQRDPSMPLGMVRVIGVKNNHEFSIELSQTDVNRASARTR